MILFFIGKSPAKPVPCNRSNGVWRRYWLEMPIENGVFLTSSPKRLALEHAKTGHVYIYDISKSIIKKSGGLHTYDNVKEVLISKEIWETGWGQKRIKLIGKRDKQWLIVQIDKMCVFKEEWMNR